LTGREILVKNWSYERGVNCISEKRKCEVMGKLYIAISFKNDTLDMELSE
jgi:hypothetical protein